MKYSNKMFFLIFVICYSSLSNAVSTLTFADAFNIKVVNGVPFEQGLFSSEKNLTLRNGLNRIAIEYEELFDSDDGDTFDIVKSEIYLLTIYVKNDGLYQQRYLKPHNVNAARQYALNPLFDIFETSTHEKINIELTIAQNDKLAYLISVTKPKQNRTINLSHPNSSKTNQSTAPPTLTTKSQSMALKMLDYWWTQATPEERKAFLASKK